MQARRTQSLPCPHVPWPASKRNDNLVQWALDRDGHLLCLGWWKRCAERRGLSSLSYTHWARFNPSFLFLTLLQDGVWLQLWSQLTASSLSFFLPRVSVSLFWRAHRFPLLSQNHTRCCWIRSSLEREGRDGSGLRWSPSWDRERTNCSFTLCCYSCLSYLTHVYTHTCAHLLSVFNQ